MLQPWGGEGDGADLWRWPSGCFQDSCLWRVTETWPREGEMERSVHMRLKGGGGGGRGWSPAKALTETWLGVCLKYCRRLWWKADISLFCVSERFNYLFVCVCVRVRVCVCVCVCVFACACVRFLVGRSLFCNSSNNTSYIFITYWYSKCLIWYLVPLFRHAGFWIQVDTKIFFIVKNSWFL